MQERIIPKNRSLSRLSSERLRRARRLYYRLILNSCVKSRNMIFVYAQRAQTRGLFSSKSGFRDVCFSILRGIRKSANLHGSKEERTSLDKSYFDDTQRIHSFCYWNRRDSAKKPRLRVRA